MTTCEQEKAIQPANVPDHEPIGTLDSASDSPLIPDDLLSRVTWASDGRSKFPRIEHSQNQLDAQFSCRTAPLDETILGQLRTQHLVTPITDTTREKLLGSVAAERYRDFLRAEIDIERRVSAAKAKLEAKRAEAEWVRSEAVSGARSPEDAAQRLAVLETEIEEAQRVHDQAAAELRQLAPLRAEAETRWHQERDAAGNQVAREIVAAMSRQIQDRLKELEQTDWLAAARAALAEIAILHTFRENLIEEERRLGYSTWRTNLTAQDVAVPEPQAAPDLEGDTAVEAPEGAGAAEVADTADAAEGNRARKKRQRRTDDLE